MNHGSFHRHGCTFQLISCSRQDQIDSLARRKRTFEGKTEYRIYRLDCRSAVGVVLSCWLGYEGYPVPRGDDDVYKSPAAELATKGRLTIPCQRAFLPHADEIFASYPQGHQLLLSAWYTVFGFSLRSTLAYSFTVHRRFSL